VTEPFHRIGVSAVPSNLVSQWVDAAEPNGQNGYTLHTTGVYNPPGSRAWLLGALPAACRAVGRTVYPVSTYLRIYATGAVLREHTDRSGLDWAVSITLESDVPWPLEVSCGCCDKWREALPGPTTGILVNSGKVPHRRSSPYPGERNVTLVMFYADEPSEEFLRWTPSP